MCSETNYNFSVPLYLFLLLRPTSSDVGVGNIRGSNHTWEWVTDEVKAIPHKQRDDNEPACALKAPYSSVRSIPAGLNYLISCFFGVWITHHIAYF